MWHSLWSLAAVTHVPCLSNSTRLLDGAHAEFYQKLHTFNKNAVSTNTSLHKWSALSGYGCGGIPCLSNDILKLVLAEVENFPLLLNHFHDGVLVSELPSFCNHKLLGQIDPNRRIIIGAGLNTPLPVPKRLSDALPMWFKNNTLHVTEDDLYISNRLRMPFIKERSNNNVIVPIFYRHGLVLDRLLTKLASAKYEVRIMLEIGAGWGGFASILKNKFGKKIKYAILDLPHSCLVQANFLYSIGYTKLIFYDPKTHGDLNALLQEDFDFIWILPQHFTSFPSGVLDLVVNFDSMVEMPKHVINEYFHHIGRLSKGFYSVNVCNLNWKYLQEGITSLVSKFGFFASTNNVSLAANYSIQPGAPAGFAFKSVWDLGLLLEPDLENVDLDKERMKTRHYVEQLFLKQAEEKTQQLNPEKAFARAESPSTMRPEAEVSPPLVERRHVREHPFGVF